MELSDLDFTYPKHGFRLHVTHWQVTAGQQVALIGPSGSGKSTLLSLMAGISAPQRGKVLLDGRDLTRLGPSARSEIRAAKIGLVFQSFELLEYLTVLDNLLLPFRLSRALRLTAASRRRAEELSERLEISEKLSRYPSQLSQGERQRVAIGRALVTKPALLLADEPTGNLDPATKKQVLDLLLENASEQNVALVMVTHDYGLLDRFERLYEVGVTEDEQRAAGIRSIDKKNTLS